jgi:NADH-quinone oxidoreductase subunit B
MAAGIARHDAARVGAEVVRASPRRADPMVAAGPVTRKMAPAIERIDDQMPGPKRVIGMGGCASAAGRRGMTERSRLGRSRPA